MQLLDSHKALLLSVLLTGIFALSLFSMKLSSEIAHQEETYIDLEEVKLLEDLLKEEQALAEQAELETHKAFNEANNHEEKPAENLTETQNTQGKKTESDDRQKSVDELLLEALENERMMLSDASDAVSVESNTSTYSSIKNSPKPKEEKNSNAENSNKDLAVVETANKNSSNYFNLKNRNIVNFPNPIYTCPTAGKIVINITVNNFGKVVDATFNASSSTSNNGCMVDNALQYAKSAVFNTDGAQQKQIGTITYIFPGQGKN